ncbi:MAG: sensor histidine kinase [Caulobacteraceae bacterium]
MVCERNPRFRRGVGAAARQAALFACGAGVLVLGSAHLYANAALALMAAIWIGAEGVWREVPDEGSAPRPALAPDLAGIDGERRTLRAFLDQTPAPLVSLGPGGALRAVNRAARSLFHTDDRVVDAPDALLTAIRQAVPGERTVARLPMPQGPRAFALSVADAVGPLGALRLAALTDIQPQIQAAEAAALRELLQILSHEIMNSLTPVASLVDTAGRLLADGAPGSTEAARDALATVGRRAEGLARFVEGYRTLARLPPPCVAPTSIASLLEDIARLFRSRWAARGVMLELASPGANRFARLDPDLMTQALLNVLANGAEAALEGGRSPAKVGLSLATSRSGVELTIWDNGPGVAGGDSEAIFRPFFTTKAEGTGVGLSFARQVARSHGGELSLLPRAPGMGAAFVLTI